MCEYSRKVCTYRVAASHCAFFDAAPPIWDRISKLHWRECELVMMREIRRHTRSPAATVICCVVDVSDRASASVTTHTHRREASLCASLLGLNDCLVRSVTGASSMKVTVALSLDDSQHAFRGSALHRNMGLVAAHALHELVRELDCGQQRGPLTTKMIAPARPRLNPG